jgi:hypothetical protein
MTKPAHFTLTLESLEEIQEFYILLNKAIAHMPPEKPTSAKWFELSDTLEKYILEAEGKALF